MAAEFNATYGGYFGQVCRTKVLGKPSDEQKRAYEAVFEASEKIAKMIKPGVSGGELCQAGIDVIQRAGYEFQQIRYGHGMGLTMAEGLDFMPDDKTVLKEGCYVMVHPHVFLPDTGNPAIVGDCFLVTKTGSERLTKAKRYL